MKTITDSRSGGIRLPAGMRNWPLRPADLLRGAGCLASFAYAKARVAILRRDLIGIAAYSGTGLTAC
jgi:hypothetical protein